MYVVTGSIAMQAPGDQITDLKRIYFKYNFFK